MKNSQSLKNKKDSNKVKREKTKKIDISKNQTKKTFSFFELLVSYWRITCFFILLLIISLTFILFGLQNREQYITINKIWNLYHHSNQIDKIFFLDLNMSSFNSYQNSLHTKIFALNKNDFEAYISNYNLLYNNLNDNLQTMINNGYWDKLTQDQKNLYLNNLSLYMNVSNLKYCLGNLAFFISGLVCLTIDFLVLLIYSFWKRIRNHFLRIKNK